MDEFVYTARHTCGSIHGDPLPIDTHTESWITATSLAHTKSVLRARGLAWRQLASELGFDADLISDPNARLPFKTLLAIYEYAADKSGDDAIGLTIGASVPIGTVGVFEYVGLSAPTLRAAFNNWVRFHSLPTNAHRLSTAEDDNFGYLCWHIPDSFGPHAGFLDWSFGLLASRIHSMFHDMPVAMISEFSHSAPGNLSEFRRVLGDNLHFNQAQDRLGVARALLDLELAELQPRVSEPNLHALMLQAALQELEKREHLSDNLLTISEHITEDLRNGDLSLEGIAAKLAMSPRTLQRVLDASGTSFRRLTEDIRLAIARRYLIETDIPLSEIAFLCGFSEQSAFSRAAKSWFGVSPKQYRQGRPSRG